MDLLISSIASIIGATIGSILTFIFERRKKHLIFKSNLTARQKTIIGNWRGFFIEEWHEDKPIIVIDNVSIELKGKLITGTCRYSFDDTTHELKLEGGYFDNNIIKLEYSNLRTSLIHFGTIIIKYSLDGITCDGNYLTYGLQQELIRHGTMHVERYYP